VTIAAININALNINYLNQYKMKKIFLLVVMIISVGALKAQENRITLSGGYVFTNIENADINATGFRINGLYEFVPLGANLAHGVSLGFIQTKASTGTLGTNYTLNSWPIYYAPKYTFGNDKIKGFLKGALGMHSSNYIRTGQIGDFESHDFGFYGGAGAGVMVFIKDKFFLNAEYEWAYLSNSYYQDGFINSIIGGIGLKF
jgi:hypothetical protein